MNSKFLDKLSISKDGFLSIGIALVVTLLFFLFNNSLGLLGAFCSVIVIYFFRDPQRVIPIADDIILSPADGLVCKIENAIPPKSSGMESEMKKVSIFLSPLNVHVNRIPVSGVVKKLHYIPGRSIRANSDASEGKNERQEILLETEDGQKVVVVQQTGFLTRRIVCNLNHEDKVEIGKRFGMIKFGSRVTIYLPQNTNILIEKGQTVIGGETIIATFGDSIPAKKRFLAD